MMKKVLYITLLVLGVFACFAHGEESSLDSNEEFAFPEKMSLEIETSKCILIVYKENNDGSKEVIKTFRVATVKKAIKTFPFGKGEITKVDLNPSWFPTDFSVEEMNKRLIAKGEKVLFKKGEQIRPRDPRNAMGSFKMHLSHNVIGKGTIYRIHGTNTPLSIGKRASSGCIRMKNEDGFPLAKNIRARKLAGEKIKVNII